MSLQSNSFSDAAVAKLVACLTWLAAFLGLGTAVGWINLSVGVLSACWLAVQLRHYFRFTLPLAKAKLKAFHEDRNNERHHDAT